MMTIIISNSSTMANKINNWLVIGILKNWETALSQPIPVWGLKPRYQGDFNLLSVGDLVWFYVTRPVSGVIGIGIVKDKYIDENNLIWEEEFVKKEVVWPLRFRLHVLKLIPKKLWKEESIKITDFNLMRQIGFHLLTDKHSAALGERLKQSMGVRVNELFSGATIAQPLALREKVSLGKIEREDYKKLSHRELQEVLAQIGKLQSYYSEIEYPLELPGEDKNLDVVWKREAAGVPTYAFEVELSGMLERAISRLKFAFQKWNSRPRIVAPQNYLKKLNNIVFAQNRAFSQEIKIFKPKQIVDLLHQKKELKSLEETLKIY